MSKHGVDHGAGQPRHPRAARRERNASQQRDVERSCLAFRFADPDAYGIQRLYSPGDRHDQAVTVRHGDVVLVRDGYHPFVAAHGYDAYYLNVLAGTRRSMAASDDPRYAAFRARWPAPDPRAPLLAKPVG